MWKTLLAVCLSAWALYKIQVTNLGVITDSPLDGYHLRTTLVFDSRLPLAQAFDRFLDIMWYQGGPLPRPRTIRDADQGGDGHVGHVREVDPLMQIQEKLVKLSKGDYFEYVMVQAPPGIVRHFGRLQFAPLEGGLGTRITWSIDQEHSYWPTLRPLFILEKKLVTIPAFNCIIGEFLSQTEH